KLSNLDTFDGSNPKKLFHFLSLLSSRLHQCPSFFNTNRLQVLYMLLYLQETAQAYFHPDILNMHEGIIPPWLNSIELFVSELQANFSPYNEVCEAKHTITTIVMKLELKIVDFIIPFQAAAIASGWGNALF
ncbi:hypothetical protein BDV98DRAFT_634587, partial [Pterulicium gracile]